MKMTELFSQKIPRPFKKTILIALLFTILGLFSTFKAAQADIEMRWKDLTAGMEEGKSANKYVLVDIYTDWCVWCKRMDKETFNDESLIHFLESKFVCVKANAEDNGAGQKLAGQYGVNGFPSTLVFDQKGKLIGRVPGYKDAQNYEAALTSILSGPNPDQ